jgi:two-component system, NarL family, response regulator DevR
MRDAEAIVLAVADELQAHSLVRLEIGSEGLFRPRLRPEQAEHLRHLVTEAFSNVLRHAHASTVAVRMTCTRRRFTLEIRDDGTGFDPAFTGDGARRGRAQGLANIRRRAELLEGRIEIESRPGTRHAAVAYDARGDHPSPLMTERAPNAAAPGAAIRILIADDHEVVRIGLAALLDGQEGLTVVAEAGSGEEAVRLARQYRPDVAVLDIRMPSGSGIEACRAITAELEGTPVVMLTSHADSEALFDAIDAGASGYVLKRVGSNELVNAVRTVAAGGSLLDPAVTRSVLDRLRNASRLEEAGAFADLTEQERRVLAHVADGASNREIADSDGPG